MQPAVVKSARCEERLGQMMEREEKRASSDGCGRRRSEREGGPKVTAALKQLQPQKASDTDARLWSCCQSAARPAAKAGRPSTRGGSGGSGWKQRRLAGSGGGSA